MNLRKKTVKGMSWSFIDVVAKESIVFVIGIILARLLSPEEFGLIGMTSIFMVLSQAIIDSGFGQALIRKKNCTEDDYSTVFVFNIISGLIIYFIFFFTAKYVAIFFNEPKLVPIIRVLSIGILIKALSLIQTIILIKNINFKLQTKISIISSIVSGLIGVTLAVMGFSVWSLVIKTLVGYLLTTILLWLWNDWKLNFTFNWQAFKELFSFGSKLLITVLIKRIYDNIYKIVIGKYFSVTELGYYTRAEQFTNLASKHLTTTVQRVSYPSLATIQDDQSRLRNAYKFLIQHTMAITLFLMGGLFLTAENLILVLIGEKWIKSVIMMKYLCVAGIFFPLRELNLNILKIKGKSDLILKLEIYKKVITVPFIIIGILFGIKVLVIGYVVTSTISYLIDSFYSGREVDYKMWEQMLDISSSLFITAVSIFLITLLKFFLDLTSGYHLIILILLYVLLNITFFEVFKNKSFKYFKSLLIETIKTIHPLQRK